MCDLLGGKGYLILFLGFFWLCALQNFIITIIFTYIAFNRS